MGLLNKFKNKKNLIGLQKQRKYGIDGKENLLKESLRLTNNYPKIRIQFVFMNKCTYKDIRVSTVETSLYSSKAMILPNGMTIEDACKVVSFLSEKVAREYQYTLTSPNGVDMVSKYLVNLGFDTVSCYKSGYFHYHNDYKPFRKIKISNEEKGVTDLFAVAVDFNVFKKSDLYDRYFDWFTSGVTEQEIKDIYERIGKAQLLEDALFKIPTQKQTR